MTGQELWFHHVGVSVTDLDASIAWWEAMLGFTVVRRYMLATIPAEIAILANGSLHVELFKVPAPKSADSERRVPDDDLRTCGNKHVAFSVENVRSFIETLRGRGADIAWIKDFPDGRSASFIRDNEGNLIEFVQWPKVDQPRASIG